MRKDQASSSRDYLQQTEPVDEIVGKAASSRDGLQLKEHVDEIVDKTASSSDCLQQRKHIEESVESVGSSSSSNVEKVFPTNDTIWEAPLQDFLVRVEHKFTSDKSTANDSVGTTVQDDSQMEVAKADAEEPHDSQMEGRS